MKLEAVVIPGSDADRAEAICDPWLEVGCEIGDALLRPGVAACARAVLGTARLHLVIAFTTAPHERQGSSTIRVVFIDGRTPHSRVQGTGAGA